MVKKTDETKKKVCKVSVIIIVFKPPRYVYEKIKASEIKTVKANGML